MNPTHSLDRNLIQMLLILAFSVGFSLGGGVEGAQLRASSKRKQISDPKRGLDVNHFGDESIKGTEPSEPQT